MSSGQTIWCGNSCGRTLTAWDLERKETTCIRCYLISRGVFRSSVTSDVR
jgi:hypothetical protein